MSTEPEHNHEHVHWAMPARRPRVRDDLIHRIDEEIDG